METVKPSYISLGRINAIAECVLGYDNIKTIFEFGARYGEDSIEFAKRYKNGVVYSFECNENTLIQCKKSISKYPNIVLTQKAVSNYDGMTTFYPIDKDNTITTWEDGNQGASSLLKASGKYELEHYVQKEVTTQCIRLDSFMHEHNIQQIDILWMDIQGAELLALKGLGKRLKDVRIIQCETEMIDIYKEQPLFKDIKKYLKKNGFCFMGFSSKSKYSGDGIFIHKDFINPKVVDLCKWILVPNTFTDNYCEIIKLKIINKYLLFLRKFKGFGKSFPVHKPSDEYDSIYNWRNQILNPLTSKDAQFGCFIKSSVPLDIVIPTTKKDLKTLEFCIDSIFKNLKHPIGKIFIVSTDDPDIKRIAIEKKCIFIDESTVIKNLSKENIHYIVNGEDRSGWLFQQLIKLSVDEFTYNEHILVMDSDTLLNRPVKYIHNGKMILNTSDEHHEPYYETYKKIMGEIAISPRSFVSHGMLFSKDLLQEMKQYITNKNHKNWIFAILDSTDYSNISGFSEYETYGNYILRHHPNRVKLEYWFNKSLTSLDEINNVPRYIKSVSLHSYNQ